jgi:uncharacterized repeat protein (TIGR03803 family)
MGSKQRFSRPVNRRNHDYRLFQPTSQVPNSPLRHHSAGGTLTTLHSFDSTDGAYPYDTLVQATDGSFYGTTYHGGASHACTGGCGTVFEITTTGALTTLYSFCSETGCTDGANPQAGLVQSQRRELLRSNLCGRDL